MQSAIAVILLYFLAFANGANDNFKGARIVGVVPQGLFFWIFRSQPLLGGSS